MRWKVQGTMVVVALQQASRAETRLEKRFLDCHCDAGIPEPPALLALMLH
jgi:hypothetical protein